MLFIVWLFYLNRILYFLKESGILLVLGNRILLVKGNRSLLVKGNRILLDKGGVWVYIQS